MNSGATHKQDGTRRPVADVPRHQWHDMEQTIEHAHQEPQIAGHKQTGTRAPAQSNVWDVYHDMPEPPEEPPILTRPPTKTYPPQKYAEKRDECGEEDRYPEQKYPQKDKYGKEAREPYPPKAKKPEPGDRPHPGEHPHPATGEQPHPGEHPHAGGEDVQGGTITVVPTAAPRQNQSNLTTGTRQELHQRLRDYIDSDADPVRLHLEQGHVHGTPQFLPWHRQFLDGFEQWQRLRLIDPAAFVPLAFWDPGDPLPSEFEHEGRNPNIPSLPLPEALAMDQLGALDYQAFASALEAYHNAVHNAIGGDMQDPRVSPNDTCFWLFHSFLDTIFAQWEALRAS